MVVWDVPSTARTYWLPGTAAMPVTLEKEVQALREIAVPAALIVPSLFSVQLEMEVAVPEATARRRGEADPVGVSGVTAIWFQDPGTRADEESGLSVLSDWMEYPKRPLVVPR